MTTKVYRPERSGGFLRSIFLVLLALFVLLLLYLFLPLGTGRAVLLGSDARAGEVSRSDPIMIGSVGGGLLGVPRDTLVEIPGVGPGTPQHINGISYWVPDTLMGQRVVAATVQ